MSIYIIFGTIIFFYLLLTSTTIYTTKLGVVNYFNKIYVVVFVLFTLLFSVLRNISVGTDYEMYSYFFYNRNFTEKFDPAINLIYWISLLFNNFQLFAILTTLIFLLVTLFLVKKYSYNIIASLSIFTLSYFYYLIFNQTRQALAIVILWIGVLAINKNKKRGLLIFIPSILVAAQFHFSAYLTFGFLIFYFVKVNRKVLILGFLIVVFGYFTDAIRSVVSPILTSITFYEAKYSTELTEFFNQNKEKGIIQFLPILVQFVFLYLWIEFKARKFISVKYGLFLETYYFCYLFLYCVAGIEATDRFQFYLYPSIIFFYDMVFYHLLSPIVSGKNERLFRLILFIIIIIFWFVYYLLRLFQNTNGIVPYLLW
ncbi:EpsG family protein [Niallia sp. 01092]|uniref:EpsG family protein n=1 Tax=Niallia sp. 01092 TaxID=3457759 RepID=UPI003FCF5E19